MSRYAFLFNPTARMGRARRHEQALRDAIAAAGLDAVLYHTERPRHAVELARCLASEADVVVAAGGDGTVHEVAEGLVAASGGAALGVVPLGTGNDFAKMLGVPMGPAAVAALVQAHPLQADYGTVAWHEDGQARTGFFCNGLGIGFDAQVAAAVPRYKRLPGVAAYLLAVFETLSRWRAPHAAVTLDGCPFFDAPFLLAAIGNGTTVGGGFVLTPAASITDGHLDLCLMRGIPRRRILTLLPRAMRGTHVHAPEVRVATFRALTLRAEAPVAIHADGEVIARAAERVAVEIVPGGLTVLARPARANPAAPHGHRSAAA